MKDLCYLSASELSKGISSGEILSEDLVKSYIDRIKKFDKTIKAWAHFDPQYILDKAIEADDYRKLGRPIGPLHGLPIAIKDILELRICLPDVERLCEPANIPKMIAKQ